MAVLQKVLSVKIHSNIQELLKVGLVSLLMVSYEVKSSEAQEWANSVLLGNGEYTIRSTGSEYFGE